MIPGVFCFWVWTFCVVYLGISQVRGLRTEHSIFEFICMTYELIGAWEEGVTVNAAHSRGGTC